MQNELLYLMALTRTPRLNVTNQRLLLDTAGSATTIFENRHDLKSILPDITPAMQQCLSDMEALLPRMEQEIEWANQKHVKCIAISDSAYPARLRECSDAPLVLYFCGNADLNKARIINMVGTRQCTEYGKDICRTFTAELAKLCPDCMVVSGLAYGVDINAHRGALQNGLTTVGVLAHGLDQIYPRLHKQTAVEMLPNGGLLTEYMAGTKMDKMNFVARNRIVAGMADATVVVESAIKGGSLITAQLSLDYNRDIFAFPGRIGDEFSAGCNKLIRQNNAHLITSAQDMVDVLGWPTAEMKDKGKKAIQRELFIDLSPEEELIVNALKGCDGKAMNQLSVNTGIAIGHLSALLFSMEMRGIVKMMNGGMYRLL